MLMPTEKKCRKCGRILPLDNFHLHSAGKYGRQSRCKDCRRKHVELNRDSIRQQQQQWTEANRERISANRKAKYQTPERKQKYLEYGRAHRKRHPEKERARQITRRAVQSGKLIQQSCQFCGNPKTQAHHEDYAKPLEVIWVCFKCHREKFHDQVVVAKDDQEHII